MKKISFLLLSAFSSLSMADYLHIHYQGTITDVTYQTILPFGFTEENPQGYQIGDTFSGTVVIDIDEANNFEVVEIPATFNAVYANTPDPRFNNQRIRYQNYMNVNKDDAIEVQNKLANASQTFIVGGFNQEPSVVNQDNIDIINGNNGSGYANAGMFNFDSITINNLDSINNPYFPFNQGHTMKRMSFTIKSETIDFISNLSLNQEFSLSGDDLIGQGGYDIYSPTVGINYTKKLREKGGIDFTLESVVAEVSPYPHVDCSICD